MRTGLMIVILLMMLGCSKVSKENYDSIRTGMSYDAVVAVLGKPNACESVGMATSCVWGNVSKHIKIRFVADKVALKTLQGVQ
jgi:hypothetical protein